MLLLTLFACNHDTTPAWAMDPIWIAPQEITGVYGFQTWELFSSKWGKKYDDKHYLCSIVVEFEGVPDTSGETCRDCDLAWQVTPAQLETDCPDGADDDPGFLSLSRIGLGLRPSDLADDDPWPGQSVGAFADYGSGDWVPYGWGYPEALDNRGSVDSTEWDGEQAFQLWPAYLWNLAD